MAVAAAATATDNAFNIHALVQQLHSLQRELVLLYAPNSAHSMMDVIHSQSQPPAHTPPSSPSAPVDALQPLFDLQDPDSIYEDGTETPSGEEGADDETKESDRQPQQQYMVSHETSSVTDNNTTAMPVDEHSSGAVVTMDDDVGRTKSWSVEDVEDDDEEEEESMGMATSSSQLDSEEQSEVEDEDEDESQSISHELQSTTSAKYAETTSMVDVTASARTVSNIHAIGEQGQPTSIEPQSATAASTTQNNLAAPTVADDKQSNAGDGDLHISVSRLDAQRLSDDNSPLCSPPAEADIAPPIMPTMTPAIANPPVETTSTPSTPAGAPTDPHPS